MSPAGYQSVIVRRGCAETTDAVTASAATRNHTTGRHFMVNTTPPRPCLVVSPISWPPDPLLAMLPLAVTPGARPRGLPCQRAKNIAGSTGRMRMRLGVIVAYRSEERRVGKEGRCRWLRYHLKKNGIKYSVMFCM